MKKIKNNLQLPTPVGRSHCTGNPWTELRYPGKRNITTQSLTIPPQQSPTVSRQLWPRETKLETMRSRVIKKRQWHLRHVQHASSQPFRHVVHTHRRSRTTAVRQQQQRTPSLIPRSPELSRITACWPVKWRTDPAPLHTAWEGTESSLTVWQTSVTNVCVALGHHAGNWLCCCSHNCWPG